MANLKQTLTEKVGPLPVWAWAGGATLLGVGFIMWRRRGKAGASEAAADATGSFEDAMRRSPSGGFSEGGGMAGGFGSEEQMQPDSAWVNQFLSLIEAQNSKIDALSLKPAPMPLAAAPSSAVPVSAPGGIELFKYQLQNAAPVPSQFYQPSATDYASAQPGGISVSQQYSPGTDPSHNYTVYGTGTGTGAVVPVDQRIAGERYDLAGRVIY